MCHPTVFWWDKALDVLMLLWAVLAGDVVKYVKTKRCTSAWLHYREKVLFLDNGKIRNSVYVCNRMVIHKICSVNKIFTAGVLCIFPVLRHQSVREI